MLVGRHVEHEAVARLLARARDGHSGVLVVRGEAGIGKTALLQDVRDTAATAGFGFRPQDVTGTESEAEFAFAGLHQLCAPMLERIAGLPEPQRVALGVAFGLRDGPAPDRFLVGLAVLNLLAEVAEDGPLLCVVDDAQWLDRASAQVLAFVARRVAAERLALVFALRDPADGGADPFDGLPELRLDGLAESDARALLAAALGTPLDDAVRDRIVGEARGNPLALLELPHSADPLQLPGGYGVPRRIEDAFRLRTESLPSPTRLLLLVAAAECTGEAALLWRAAAHLGVEPGAAGPATAAGLLEVDTRVRFRHPLVRSAVYRTATTPDRRRAHGALAAAIDPEVDPDRRAWHRGQAVLGADEPAAAELERSAGRARARGGLAASAAFLRRAVELTPDPARRAGRALDAAQVEQEAGAADAARDLLSVATAGPLDPRQRARVQLLRAQLSYHLTRGSDAPRSFLAAADALAPLDAGLARDTYLQALDAALIASSASGDDRVREVAEAARAAPPRPGAPRPADLLLAGMATTYSDGYAAGAPRLRRALAAFRGAGPHGVDGDGDRWLWTASRCAVVLFDDDLALVLGDRTVRLAREAGALTALPTALAYLSSLLVLTGEFAGAAALAEEGSAISAATGAAPVDSTGLVLAAWRGAPGETAARHATVVQEATARGEGTEVSLAHWARAVLHNGSGDYATACGAAARATETDELTIRNVALPELVEAASRAGEPERSAAAAAELDARARAAGTEWALGLAARSRALTTDGPEAEKHYLEAVGHLGRCRMATHLARTHLVYGEWLRREGRRQDAREQLRTAHELLSGMGAEAFAARAARELRATGEQVRKRSAAPVDALTAQETQIARLVATGATSREVAAQLFLSPRTIEAHLRSLFRKLGITSRRQLRDLRLP
ncbi:LuxR family transcriptional regulator [Pseudonocardia petroleophila]|uniref:AAA family ATPase n=1 Tax=Pseudonocardia petroleophila TaxID=37331 RepID=A0A7G7MIS7_9PSEU|nr:helix-turn-helix transcriptional regulator [Pseudonocardia petroleophila]QNG52688.1 AAA family ATPase [Pseudonocardia petroleophila]